MVNLVVLHGNLTRDPELKSISTGTSVVNFGIAVSRYYKKADGSKGQDTVFIDCEAWDTGAELVEKLLKKGDGVIVEGSLKMDQWEKDGQKHSKLKVRVNNFTKIARQEKLDSPSDGQVAVATAVAVDSQEEEKTPF